MPHSSSPHICETCGRSYVIDGTAGAHMDPPDDYCQGYQRFCLACWLGVGPKDWPDMRLAERMNPQEESPSLYLWLCCEGWMRFGPFKWLRFDDERQAIVGPDRDEVAKKMDGFWRVSGEKWQGWGFSDPTITTTPQRPHKDSSSPPVLKR
jgi:hypothetical protein